MCLGNLCSTIKSSCRPKPLHRYDNEHGDKLNPRNYIRKHTELKNSVNHINNLSSK